MTGWHRRERRAARRLAGAECLAPRARLRPGGEVEVLNLSSGGTAIDAAPRLLPGATVQLDLWAPGWRRTVTALVVRCAVSGLSADSGARYKAGLRFAGPLEPPFPESTKATSTADGDP